MQNQLETIRELIAKNQVNEALLVLLKLSGKQPDIENTILSTIGEYNDLRLQINRGTLQGNESEQRKSSIRIKTLELADMLFRMNKTQTISLDGNQLIIKEKKLNSIRVLTIMNIAFGVVGVLALIIANYVLAPGGSLKDFAEGIAIFCLFTGSASFIGLLLTLVVNAIKN